MNPGDSRSRARLERIVKELKAGDLDQWQIADLIVIGRGNGIREYIQHLIDKHKIHVVDWRRYSENDGPYIPVLRHGPGVNKPKPAPKPRTQIKADRYAKLKADKERYEDFLRRQRARRRKPPKPDDMLAWVFKPKGEVNGN